MVWLDIAMLLVLLTSVLLGLWRGLVFELLSILGWVVAYLGCSYVAPWITPWLPQDTLDPAAGQMLALVLGFVVILVVWGLSARLLRALIHATPLSLIDRVLGSGFGLLRGALLCMLAVVLMGMTPLAYSQGWQASWLRPWMQVALQLAAPLLPADMVKFMAV